MSSKAHGAVRHLNSAISKARRIEDVAKLVQEHLHSFDKIHTTTCLHVLAKLSSANRINPRKKVCSSVSTKGSSALFSLVAKQARFLQERKLDGRQLSNTIWAIARLQQAATSILPNGFLQQSLLELARYGDVEDDRNSVDAAVDSDTLCSGFSGQVVNVSKTEKESRRTALNHQDVSNALWALAILQPLISGNLTSVTRLASCQAITHNPAGFKPQELANSIWALATFSTGYTVLKARRLASFCVAHRLKELEPMHLGSIAWAVATASLEEPSEVSTNGFSPPPSLIEAIVHEASLRRASFPPQELANTCWAMSTLSFGCNQSEQFQVRQLATEAVKRSSEFNHQELVNTAWAFAEIWPVKFSQPR
eukprot:TRINITY_DN11389_c1_g1_i1.p1 TRINITY_DN11389_c1_g1~~TRINITY_DN11389_c1_g1_i1.p1  ORF type:complete len:374 (-),score=44.71 TRINITY_DN11389_c1_g1_i1:279-1379(-)